MKKQLTLTFFLCYVGVFSSRAQDTITVNFAYTGAVQNWTVPCGVKQIKIQIAGGSGGAFNYLPGTYPGGDGASFTGQCTVKSGDNLSIICGRIGNGSHPGGGGGGGGGSFVYDSNTLDLLIVAGGGGGAGGFPSVSGAGGAGGTDLINNKTTNGGDGCELGGVAGNGGSGGILNGGAGGGAGWISNGGNVAGTYPCNGGSDKANSFVGGTGVISDVGGYGGGGGGEHGGGGGGGYNGGGGGDTSNAIFSGGGGGGGSYLNGTLIGIPKANNAGYGFVSITYYTSPPLKENSITVNKHASCNGGNNGSASIAITGGTSPYSYAWSDAGSQTTDTAKGLSVGTYTVIVSDSCGALVTDSVKITQPNALIASASISANVTCNGGNNGSAFVTASGGTTSYTYSWSDVSSQTNAAATGLSAGSYTVTVSDSCGAFVIDSIKIIQPAAMVLTADSTNVSAGCNGSAWVTISGGTSPFSYLWNTGLISDTITNQCGGNYCCVITDANGCKDSACTTINITTEIGNINSGSNQFILFPNPNNGIFNIADQDKASVDIYNALGQKVFTTKVNTSKTAVDLSNNPPGIYLYRVLTESCNLISEGKFIIQK